MFSSSALNSKALNATTSAAVVLAAAAWVTSSSAEFTPSHQQSANANIDCHVDSIWSAYQDKYAVVRMDASAEFVVPATLIHHGAYDWNASVTLTAYLLNEVSANVNFDGTANWLLLPDSLIANYDWITTSEITIDVVKTQALTSNLVTDSQFLIDEFGVSRGATTDWLGEANFLIEGTLTNENGDVFHSGHANWVAESTGYVDQKLLTLFIATSFWFNDAELSLDTTVNQAMYVDIEHTTDIVFNSVRVYGAKADLVATANFTGILSNVINVYWDIEANVTISGTGGQINEGNWEPITDSSFTSEAIRNGGMLLDLEFTDDLLFMGALVTKLPQLNINTASNLESNITLNGEAKVDFEGIGAVFYDDENVEVFRLANVDWQGSVSFFSAASTVVGAPSTDNRRFIVPYQNRTFIVGEADRTFYVGNAGRAFAA